MLFLEIGIASPTFYFCLSLGRGIDLLIILFSGKFAVIYFILQCCSEVWGEDEESFVLYWNQKVSFQSHPHCFVVQTGYGALPASYPIGTRGFFPGGKAAGAWSLALICN
jgi:hypothetical protein